MELLESPRLGAKGRGPAAAGQTTVVACRRQAELAPPSHLSRAASLPSLCTPSLQPIYRYRPGAKTGGGVVLGDLRFRLACWQWLRPEPEPEERNPSARSGPRIRPPARQVGLVPDRLDAVLSRPQTSVPFPPSTTTTLLGASNGRPAPPSGCRCRCHTRGCLVECRRSQLSCETQISIHVSRRTCAGQRPGCLSICLRRNHDDCLARSGCTRQIMQHARGRAMP